MTTQALAHNLVSVLGNALRKNGGIVILPVKEYQRLCARAVPTIHLKGKEAEELDNLVEEGLKEYKAGKCKVIRSLADLE